MKIIMTIIIPHTNMNISIYACMIWTHLAFSYIPIVRLLSE